MSTRSIITLLLIAILSVSCSKKKEQKLDNPVPLSERIIESSEFKTKNIIVIVIDGARYSETWGDSSHRYIPRLSEQLAPQGVVNSQFFNEGHTNTVAGHTAITTGTYQKINNGGSEIPKNPSFFQYWAEEVTSNNTLAWIITSKDKLEVLANAKSKRWKGKHRPSTDCGIAGLESGYREDSVTYQHALDILDKYHPQLVLINLREPDFSGHTGDWEAYTSGIQSSDEYVYKLWNFLEQDEWYRGTTTLFVTNDHGRHLDEIEDGFVSHGDSCPGCRHINLFALGPDFKKGIEVSTRRELIDIPATISTLLDFDMPTGDGENMSELFLDYNEHDTTIMVSQLP